MSKTIPEGAPGYIIDIERDIEDRAKWNEYDSLIMKRREGARKKKLPYPGAPNPVVNIIDDVVTERTDIEITMITNVKRLALFIPIGNTTPEQAQKAAKAFDTLLRFFMDYRRKKEQLVDTKNARGFSVWRLTRKYCKQLGRPIPYVMADDPKDWILPSNTTDRDSAERATRVIRMSKRQFLKQEDRGWKHVKTVSDLVFGKKDDDQTSVNGSKHSDDDEDNPVAVIEDLVGINASNGAVGEIVIWEIRHYATEWDVENSDDPSIKVGRKCVSYFCPDQAEYMLHIKPWKEDDILQFLTSPEERISEVIAAAREGRKPEFVKVVQEGEDREWEFGQHRNENSKPWWYAVRGLGHTCMDDHMNASGLMRRKQIITDFTSNPMFEHDGTGNVNEQSFSPRPGKVMKKGLKYSQFPQPPTNLDFDIDYHKRVASLRAHTQTSLYSSEVSTSGKLQKTATESSIQATQSATLSSASVERFNDSDTDMFRLIWEDLKRLQVPLPIISNGTFEGTADAEIYSGQYVIVPQSSAKSINPDLEFMKAREATTFLTAQAQAGAYVDVNAATRYTVENYDPNYAEVAMPDPDQPGPQGQPPLNVQLQQIGQALQSLQQTVTDNQERLQATMKLAMENKEDTLNAQALRQPARV